MDTTRFFLKRLEKLILKILVILFVEIAPPIEQEMY